MPAAFSAPSNHLSRLRPGAPPRPANFVALFLLVAAAGGAALTVSHEAKIERISKAASAATIGQLGGGQSDVRTVLANCERASDNRILLSCTSAMAALARDETDRRARFDDLDNGRRALAKLDKQGSAPGETRVASALLASMGPAEGDTAHAIAAISQSYLLLPYSHDLGLWRIAYASRHWDALDATTRRAVMAEGIWYGSIGQTDRAAVIAALNGTPAFISVALRLPGAAGG